MIFSVLFYLGQGRRTKFKVVVGKVLLFWLWVYDYACYEMTHIFCHQRAAPVIHMTLLAVCRVLCAEAVSATSIKDFLVIS